MLLVWKWKGMVASIFC